MGPIPLQNLMRWDGIFDHAIGTSVFVPWWMEVTNCLHMESSPEDIFVVSFHERSVDTNQRPLNESKQFKFFPTPRDQAAWQLCYDLIYPEKPEDRMPPFAFLDMLMDASPAVSLFVRGVGVRGIEQVARPWEREEET